MAEETKTTVPVDLFGNPRLTPRQVMQRQLSALLQSVAARTAAADPRTRGVSMMGAAVGGLLRNVLINKGVLPKPPEVERAEKVQAIDEELNAKAREQGLSLETNPKEYFDLAASIALRANAPDLALRAVQMRQMYEANERAAEKERAQIENIEADTDLKKRLPAATGAGRGEYFVPIQTAEGVKAFDTRRGVIVDPATGDPVGKPVVSSGSDPRLQGELAGTKTQSQEAGKLATQEAENALKISDQVETAMEGIDKLLRYTRGSFGGTGMFATAGGLKRFTDADLQDLEATFNKINLKNLVTTFQGFSRSIDTAVERSAWERTQPNITLDDKVNLNILIGNISLGAKAAAEGQARRAYIESSPKKNLEGYRSPIIGKTRTLFNPNGEVQVVPKERVKDFEQEGWMDADAYAEFLMQRAKGSVPNGWKVKVNSVPDGWKVRVK